MAIPQAFKAKWFWYSVGCLISFTLFVICVNLGTRLFSEHIGRLKAAGIPHPSADRTIYFYFIWGALPVGLLLWVRRGFKMEKSCKGTLFSLVFGTLGGIGQYALFTAFENGEGQTALITAITGVYGMTTAVLAFFFLREKLNRRQIGGLLFGAVAILIISLAPPPPKEVTEAAILPGSVSQAAPSQPAAKLLQTWFVAALVVLFSWGIVGVFQKLASNHISAESTIIWQSLAFFFLLPVVIPTQPLLSYPTPAIVWGLLSGFLTNVGTLFLVAAMKNGGKASIVAPLTSLYPLVYAVVALVFFGEAMTALQGSGVLSAMAAIVLLSL